MAYKDFNGTSKNTALVPTGVEKEKSILSGVGKKVRCTKRYLQKIVEAYRHQLARFIVIFCGSSIILFMNNSGSSLLKIYFKILFIH